MNTTIHTLHVALAGAWLGGVIFTTMVVSPTLKAMKWAEAERVSVRSKIGEHYARVGGVNLVLLALFAILDGLTAGFGVAFYAEYALLVALLGLVMAHGAYLGRRLTQLAEAEKRAGSEEEARTFAGKRRDLQRLSLRISWADIAVSTAVVVLAINAS
jgi:uncharacterized membrane protein